MLRETWRSHIESSLYRPVLLIDEAQDMQSAVLNELRFLSSAELDSRSILTVILAGDSRLTRKLQHADLLPIGSRIRTRLRIEYSTPQNLRESLMYVLRKAGNPKLINTPLVATLCDHAAGNYRTLMNMANDLLAAAVHGECDALDEKLFFEVFAIDPKPTRTRTES